MKNYCVNFPENMEQLAKICESDKSFKEIIFTTVNKSNKWKTQCKLVFDKIYFIGKGNHTTLQLSIDKSIQNAIFRYTEVITPCSTITIGKLHPRTSVEDIVDLCTIHGTVLQCCITNYVARVEMSSLLEATKIMQEYQDRELDGKPLNIRFSNLQIPKPIIKNIGPAVVATNVMDIIDETLINFDNIIYDNPNTIIML